MSRLRIVPIVEGHGETLAARTLLQRTWMELLGGEYVEVARPIREKRGRLTQERGLQRAVELALKKLANPGQSQDPGLVLVLLDADKDCAADLGPRLQLIASQVMPGADIACIVATVEYETWFVAAAESLSDSLSISASEPPADPEGARAGKGWIQKHFKGKKYSETVDQPALTAKMDLALCRQRSPSFDKLCRELERRLAPA